MILREQQNGVTLEYNAQSYSETIDPQAVIVMTSDFGPVMVCERDRPQLWAAFQAAKADLPHTPIVAQED